MDNPDMIHQTASGRSSRRGILAALGLGSAATALFASARPAQAQTTDTTVAPTADTTPTETTVMATAESTPGTEPQPVAALTSASPETTLPPKKVQPEDLPLLGAAKVLELTAAEACESAAARADGLGLDDAGKELLAALGAHHRAYAEALSALYGPGSPSTPNAALHDLLGGSVFAEGSATDALNALHDLEHHCSDTHQTLLGLLLSTDAAALVASIQIVEARHGAVLAILLGKAYGADELAIEDAADALSLAQITGGN